MPNVQRMEVNQDDDNLTWQMLVSLFQLLSENIELFHRFQTLTKNSLFPDYLHQQASTLNRDGGYEFPAIFNLLLFT